MVAAAPRIRRILKICEPIILPMAMSELPLRAAEIEVTNSGKLVLKATMVLFFRKQDLITNKPCAKAQQYYPFYSCDLMPCIIG